MGQNHGTDLVVTLDVPRLDRALGLVGQFCDLPILYKVGIELYLSAGPEIVRELVHRRCRVFLDLKFHDIPSVAAKAARQAALLQVEMFSVHLVGGSAMLKAITQELSDIPHLRPKVLGVSVLTSFDDVKWAEVTKSLTGHAVDTRESVLDLVDHSIRWGADGVICSAFELEDLRPRFPSLYTMVEGIQPQELMSNEYSSRVMTPLQAMELGASSIILGRSLWDAESPREIVETILKDLSISKFSA